MSALFRVVRLSHGHVHESGIGPDQRLVMSCWHVSVNDLLHYRRGHRIDWCDRVLVHLEERLVARHLGQVFDELPGQGLVRTRLRDPVTIRRDDGYVVATEC